MLRDTPLLQIGLCTNNNTGNLVYAGELGDLVIDNPDHIERLA